MNKIKQRASAFSPWNCPVYPKMPVEASGATFRPLVCDHGRGECRFVILYDSSYSESGGHIAPILGVSFEADTSLGLLGLPALG